MISSWPLNVFFLQFQYLTAMQSRLAGLDALRGIAAFAVFAHHLHMAAFGYSRGSAFLAVDLFFMLSGYVMARTYEARLNDSLSAASFITSRIRRLWPTMTVGAVIGIPVVWLSYSPERAALATLNLLFIPYFLEPRAFPLNGPAWSIFFELVANLLHALVLYRLRNSQLFLLAGAGLLVLFLYGRQYGFDVGSQPDNFLLGLPRIIMSYAIGIILWRTWRDQPPIRVSRSFTLLAMPLFFGATVLMSGQSWLANLLFIIVVCPALIAGALQLQASPFWLNVAALGGAVSFPLYAVHGTVIRLAGVLDYGWAIGGASALLVVALFPSVRSAFSHACPVTLRKAAKV